LASDHTFGDQEHGLAERLQALRRLLISISPCHPLRHRRENLLVPVAHPFEPLGKQAKLAPICTLSRWMVN
jgi:hypothetical protein